MNTKYESYRKSLEELLSLLENYNEENWFKYFSKSLVHLHDGKSQKSISHSLGAYGGKGSFNDELYFTGAPSHIAQRGFELRDTLWAQCKNTQSLLKRIFEL